jgi:hypothetical protein
MKEPQSGVARGLETEARLLICLTTIIEIWVEGKEKNIAVIKITNE